MPVKCTIGPLNLEKKEERERDFASGFIEARLLPVSMLNPPHLTAEYGASQSSQWHCLCRLPRSCWLVLISAAPRSSVAGFLTTTIVSADSVRQRRSYSQACLHPQTPSTAPPRRAALSRSTSLARQEQQHATVSTQVSPSSTFFSTLAPSLHPARHLSLMQYRATLSLSRSTLFLHGFPTKTTSLTTSLTTMRA